MALFIAYHLIDIYQDKPAKMYEVAAMNAPQIIETALGEVAVARA